MDLFWLEKGPVARALQHHLITATTAVVSPAGLGTMNGSAGHTQQLFTRRPEHWMLRQNTGSSAPCSDFENYNQEAPHDYSSAGI
jgi:hypothetical protein